MSNRIPNNLVLLEHVIHKEAAWEMSGRSTDGATDLVLFNLTQLPPLLLYEVFLGTSSTVVWVVRLCYIHSKEESVSGAAARLARTGGRTVHDTGGVYGVRDAGVLYKYTQQILFIILTIMGRQ